MIVKNKNPLNKRSLAAVLLFTMFIIIPIACILHSHSELFFSLFGMFHTLVVLGIFHIVYNCKSI